MAQSLARIVIHVVFATKGRAPWIPNVMRRDLYAAMSTTLAEFGCLSIRVGGSSDHVHLLFALARTVTVAEVVEAVKVRSSYWMKQNGSAQFGWQAGYGAFSVGERQIAVVSRYIERQDEHHRRLSFQEEFRRILVHYGVRFDERYVWD